MKPPYDIALEKAAEYDKTLLANNDGFNKVTVVKHEDGSHFMFMNAFAIRYDFVHQVLGDSSYFLVFSEHHGCHVYDCDDVEVTVLNTIGRGTLPINTIK